MSEKLDLARMLREIREDTASQSSRSRPLTQDEIRRMISERQKSTEAKTK